jgi:uncharacterized membrane protein
MADWEQENKEATESVVYTDSNTSEFTLGDYEVNIGHYLSSGWSLFASKMGGFIGFTFLLMLVNIILGVVPVIGTIASFVINAPLAAGYYIVARKLMNGEETQFGDFFKGFDYFLPLLLAGLVSGIFIFLGLIVLILPGIYLAIGYMFTAQFVVHKNLSFFEAMEISRKLITKKWLMFFAISLLIFLINIVGLILLGVGVLFTIPFTICALAVAFDDIVNKQLS